MLYTSPALTSTLCFKNTIIYKIKALLHKKRNGFSHIGDQRVAWIHFKYTINNHTPTKIINGIRSHKTGRVTLNYPTKAQQVSNDKILD